MLLFDDSKKLEKALGEEAASVLVHVFENADEKWRRELATKADLIAVKADLMAVKAELKEDIAKTKHEILKMVRGVAVGQTAVILAVMALLRPT